jgi:LacI family transcriptional regulator
MDKPKMQDIATALSTSRVSVWRALNEKPGVSKELREKVFEKAREIGYLKEIEIFPEKRKTAGRTIAVVVSRPESSVFWMQIIHQIAKELSQNNVTLMYTYMPVHFTEGDTLPEQLNDGSISGIIVLNIYSEPQLRMLAELPIPKVFLDSIPALPPDKMGGDIVIIEGRTVVNEITGSLLDNGKMILGFVGDINYAQTNMDRYMGFKDAHAKRGLKIDETYSLIGKLHLDTHYNQISDFLSSLKSMPDGFVCTSDYIAHFIERYFTENNIDHSKIHLTGFDNSTEYPNVANKITTVDVKTTSMGERLANKIMFSTNYPDVPHEVSYVLTKVIYR